MPTKCKPAQGGGAEPCRETLRGAAQGQAWRAHTSCSCSKCSLPACSVLKWLTGCYEEAPIRASIPCFLPRSFLLARHCHIFISYILSSCSVLIMTANQYIPIIWHWPNLKGRNTIMVPTSSSPPPLFSSTARLTDTHVEAMYHVVR